MATIEQILRMSATERKAAFGVSALSKHDGKPIGIETVIIDGNAFTDYGAFSFLWEKSYVKSPVRSGDGSIGNLNSYSTFITPHLKIDFSMMSIDSYRALMKLIYGKNEFTVTCYDVVNNEMTTNRMYFSTEEMPKLWTIARAINGEEWVELLGVQEYTVEMIGTNTSLDLVSVRYIVNAPDGASPDFAVDEGEPNVYKGEQLVIGGGTSIPNETFGGAYKFTTWNISPDGGVQGNYRNGYAYTINTDLVLYAQWEETTSHTLTFNYGVADVIVSENPSLYETSRTVVTGKSIGYLPVVHGDPYVEIKKDEKTEKHYPYRNGAWYRTPIKAENSKSISNNELYWSNRDSAIYLIYEKKNLNIRLFVKDNIANSYYMPYQNITAQYDDKVVLPIPQKTILVDNPPNNNKLEVELKFDGWYLDEGKTEKFMGKMPPHDIDLYGDWYIEESR